MADILRRLTANEPLRRLQEQLECWAKNYNTNSCDQNINNCLEFIEQIAKVQGQLFGILNATAQEGGCEEGMETIKSRLLPWLESSTAAFLGRPPDNKPPCLQDTYDRDKQKEPCFRDPDAQQLNFKLSSTRSQINQLQDKPSTACTAMSGQPGPSTTCTAVNNPPGPSTTCTAMSNPPCVAETGKTCEQARTRSTVCLLAAEEEINQLKKQLKSLQAQEAARQKGCAPRRQELLRAEPKGSIKQSADQQDPEVCEMFQKQIRELKDEIAVLSAEKSNHQGRCTRSQSPNPEYQCQSDNYCSSRSTSPCTTVAKPRSPSPNQSKMCSMARKAALLSRFSDAYSQARLDAQCLLRRCIDNAETVQRIIYIAIVEAFHVAKMAFRHFKIRVRKSMTPSYACSNDFENAVMEYIVCHLDLYDSQSSVNDVICAMNINPKISFPPEVDFCLLSDFIQEICCIAFAMQSLDPPLDIAFGADGEIFNDCKYRRSYDSDFTAPLVFYHVWPALMEIDNVIMKGEAVTKRGAFWNSVRSVSRCRSRSLSPIYPRSRIGLNTVSRSRSPSPIRCPLSRF
ncbi:mitochondria-eating protein isoform X10 [Cavia porcellus]|uniref:mitochondria-eating protein isoform X10 n=1 Tax=Cavia porcellus TaxID=10141 RepID=UPI000661E1C5|nr:mitochondria-eating protein isoform X11 [Cavia porcellus]